MNNLKIYKVNDYDNDSYYLCKKCENIFIKKNQLINHLNYAKCSELNDEQWFDDWLFNNLFGLVDCLNKYKNEQIDDFRDFIDNKTRKKIKKLLINADYSTSKSKNYVRNILRLFFQKHKNSIIKSRRLRETCYEVVE